MADVHAVWGGGRELQNAAAAPGEHLLAGEGREEIPGVLGHARAELGRGDLQNAAKAAADVARGAADTVSGHAAKEVLVLAAARAVAGTVVVDDLWRDVFNDRKFRLV